MTLYLIRGLPGSGKSTLARRLGEVVEADMFFLVNGVYCYDPMRIQSAHNWCQTTTRELIQQDKDVAVANTFTRRWELAPYYEMNAQRVVELTVNTTLNDEELAARTVHGVPAEMIRQMRERWET